MVAVLSDPSLYEFTGGTPPTLEELTDRYTRQAVGHSPDGTEQWLNWVVLLDSAPVGYVQATVVGDSAEIAWVISPSVQGRGLATEAARSDERVVERRAAYVGSSRTCTPTTRPRRGRRAARAAAYGRGRGRRGPLGPRLPCRLAGVARRPGGAAPGPARVAVDHGDPLADLRAAALRRRPRRMVGADRRATVALAPGETLLDGGATLPRACTCSGRSTTSGCGWPSATPSSRWPSATAA